MDPDEAAKLYLRRIESKIPVFETMNENELNYVKMINAGRAFFYNNLSFNVCEPLFPSGWPRPQPLTPGLPSLFRSAKPH